ncbi:MAG: class I SAM-dependent methyltransferase [Thermoleophilia bacterium]
MERIPEPELMDETGQARAYARADFEQPHNRFIEIFHQEFPGIEIAGRVLDLGCGPGDIAIRFARAFPRCSVLGLDGAPAMLAEGQALLARSAELQGRVRLQRCLLPDEQPPVDDYTAIISNSLLHHLRQPDVLWQAIRGCGHSGTPVFVMDLARPPDPATADLLVKMYTAGEPDLLKRDFQASLFAAYEPAQVTGQLLSAGLDCLRVRTVSDRHLLVSGRLP